LTIDDLIDDFRLTIFIDKQDVFYF